MRTLPIGPEATPGQRLGARTIDGAIETVASLIVAATGPHGRPLVSGAIAFALIAAYETLCIAGAGATLGKRALGLMVVPVDREGKVPLATAFKRGAAIASAAFGFFVSPALGVAICAYLGTSMAASAHHRAGHDRVANTFVVVAERRPRVVTSDQFDKWIDPRHAKVWSPIGLVATFDERRRARARRLEHAPLLLAYLVASTLAFVTIWQSVVAFIWLSVAWIGAFAVDETIRIHRWGATPGHADFGLVVIDRRTGRPPGWFRSAVRAIVLGLFMFTPLLPLLALWVKAEPEHRGPHDLAAGTAVITHPARSHRFAFAPVPPTVPVHRF